METPLHALATLPLLTEADVSLTAADRLFCLPYPALLSQTQASLTISTLHGIGIATSPDHSISVSDQMRGLELIESMLA